MCGHHLHKALFAVDGLPLHAHCRTLLLQALSELRTWQQGFGDRVYRHGGRLQALQAGVSLRYDCVASRCRQIRTQRDILQRRFGRMCNSYGWGFCRGLSAAFQKQEAEHQEWGLVMVVPQAVEDAVSKMKRSSYKISPQSSMNHQYAAMGYADGQEFDMRRRLDLRRNSLLLTANKGFADA